VSREAGAREEKQVAQDDEVPEVRGTAGDEIVQYKFEPGLDEFGAPLEEPTDSTPLDEDEPEGTIPPAPLWAMKDRRHFFGTLGHGDAVRIRRALGIGDEAVHFIDDGRTHCMVGRRVGRAPDGCVYCLVGRIKLDRYEDLDTGQAPLSQAFSDAHDIALLGVFEDDSMSSEVFLVKHFGHAGDVPDEYLPPNPFIDFADTLPVEV
jgi:hypothetical protein